jgi:hypothetical protein
MESPQGSSLFIYLEVYDFVLVDSSKFRSNFSFIAVSITYIENVVLKDFSAGYTQCWVFNIIALSTDNGLTTSEGPSPVPSQRRW